ncbi:MAG: glutamate--tRNA ligase family protein, partial [Alphaproteobacteria bacterium]|nr:glutamate--tRNA ligase family protein [Alphaproteobacteria bacterium]
MAITRFAPSPTGYLHLGHAYSALFAARAAEGGTFLLRIEDIDQGRCKPEFTESIFEDLHWLGFSWPEPVRRQSKHLDDYGAALERLRSMGLVYPCFCSRKEIEAEAQRSGVAPHAEDGTLAYPGRCRQMAEPERRERLARGETAN